MSRIGGSWILALLIAAAAVETVDGSTGPSEVERLLGKLAAEPPLSVEQVASELAVLEEEAQLIVFAAWTGQLPIEPPARTDDEAARCTPEEFRQRVVEATARAMTRQSTRTMVTVAERWIDRSPELLEAFGEIGRLISDVDAMWGPEVLLASVDSLSHGPALQSPALQTVYRGALGTICRRDERSASILNGVFDDPTLAPLWDSSLAELAAVGGSAGWEAVENAFGNDPLLDQQILRALSTHPPLRLAAPEGALEEVLTEALRDRDTSVRRLAAWLAGGFRVRGAAEALIARLEDPDPRTRQLAADALRSSFGRPLPAEVGAWNRWWDEEIAWKEQRGRAWASELEEADEPLTLRLLGELALHPLHFDALIDRWIHLTAHPSDEVRRAAARILTDCTPRLVLAEWVDALDDADPAVRSLVGEALRQATGLQLPAERWAWAEAGFGR